MAPATSHHHRLLLGAATSSSSSCAAASSRPPRPAFLRFPAAPPAPLAAARRICCQSVDSAANVLGASSTTSDEAVPVPVVLIDQDSDRDATIVHLSFGDRLGALLDTMKALKDLGLDVTKGSVATDSAVTETKFHIMRLGRKVEDPDMLERIRLTIINNLLKYHPESSEKLAMGEFFGIKPPEKKESTEHHVAVDIATHVVVEDDGPKRSYIADLTVLRGLQVPVVMGLVAKDKFHVSYRGAKLDSSLSQALINCLRYYLRRPETDEDSY
ncbi:hypothetical protein U9M48_005192 [Paspalum notatum var. saurae]|uniref:ACT domain-containing protein ACR n=1 Tax=Paspalum notatum var. saurae TaxID=547442 RepID=A0AAQ3PQA3_PASNO